MLFLHAILLMTEVVLYGCSDPLADNYWDEGTECEDGTSDNCCDYTEPVLINFGVIMIIL